MPRPTAKTPKSVETLKHDQDKRKNIPTAELQSVLEKEKAAPQPVSYKRTSAGLEKEKETRNRDLDPQLVWRGKDEQDWSDLVVHAPPLYIQEKVHPKVLIDDLLRQTKEAKSQQPGFQTDLFADFNGIPKGVDKTEFYQHDQNWSNRMILGDSLQVMASLAEREGLRGKVQCIYFDPPYGIRFNSNFQWSTTSRDVKDGNAGHITREPEQVKAFRDTWRDGIHSYLTYLRDRLTVARDLLKESGSIFVQIGDENRHRIRALLDEVFGEENFVSEIAFRTTTGRGARLLDNNFDFAIWYAKSFEHIKYRQAFVDRDETLYDYAYDEAGMGHEFGGLASAVHEGWTPYNLDNFTSQGESPEGSKPLELFGRKIACPSGRHWRVSTGRDRLTESLARLTGDEQKAAKTTAFDLQLNPESPGLSFHKLEKAKDKNFWSVRVGRDVRLIVHKSPGSILLCYVAHHDKAYAWAERRKLETHPTTGAAQLVEIREMVQEVFVPIYTQSKETKPELPFKTLDDDELLSYGVPREWIQDVRSATEDTILAIAERLPSEAAEAVLELATGGTPRRTSAANQLAVAEPGVYHAPPGKPEPFEHPDAQRRFRVMSNVEDLQQALEFPWDKWTIFLHPEQRQIVDHNFTGPARVSGSAGTGKTIVALHRAVLLARVNPNARVLLTTFSHILANALRTKLRRLISNEPRLGERIDVHSINAVGGRLYKSLFGQAAGLVPRDTLTEIIRTASGANQGHKFTLQFLISEWDQVVDAWQLTTWEAYRDVPRLGRRTRLPEPQRNILWSIFSEVNSLLVDKKLMTVSAMFTRVAEALAAKEKAPYDFAIVDEAQDLSVAQLRFLAALGHARPDALFFAGDLGQRIFQQPFSWLGLGVDIRGRSRNLRVNYRTSHQIRSQADRLLGPEVADADGNTEKRNDTISIFNGPLPEICILKNATEEQTTVADWLVARSRDGVAPHEFGVFVRSDTEIPRAEAALKASGLPYKILDENVETTSGFASISTMHLAKGLEFRAVAVLACDDEIIPSQERIEKVGEEGDLKEIYDTERHLLYVACTRARDYLLITSVEPSSEFLDDLKS